MIPTFQRTASRRLRQHCVNSWTKRRKLSFCVVLCCLLWIYYYSTSNAGFMTRPCRIHVLDPWDKSLEPFIERTTKHVNCSKRHTLFFVDQNGFLQLNKTSVSLYNITLSRCVYRVITRYGDMGIDIADEMIDFRPPIFIDHEVFSVICNNTVGQTVYQYVHFNLMRSPNKERVDTIGNETDDQLSIIFIGIDSLSRSHAMRFLPKTYSYLTENLGAFDMKGYMKVGTNTFPNIVALLTGRPESEYYLQNYKLAHLDDMPFIWKEDSMRSYITHLNEDMPNIGTFTYHKLGFTDQPVDYYYRLYALAMYLIQPIIVEPLPEWYSQNISEPPCYGNMDHLDLQLEYYKRFLSNNSGRLKFSLFWNNHLGHDYFNMMSRGDEILLEFLQWLEREGHLKRSVLFFGSDHGFRMGDAGMTYIGRLESNMPLMTVRLPDILVVKYPHIHENLEYNAGKLVSPFDIYETMKAVFNKDFNVQVNPGVSAQAGLTRRSIFHNIPETRNCVNAGIPERYCTCSESHVVSLDTPTIQTLALQCVEYLNKLLEQYADKCRRLTLHNISEARLAPLTEGDPPFPFTISEYLDYFGFIKHVQDGEGRYTILFYTDPNDGLFEMMLDYKPVPGSDVVVQVIGEPARVNVYGNQSYCVDGGLPQQICLCY